MPSNDIKSVIDGKHGLNFTIKTAGGAKWKCQLHSDRASYEKTRATTAQTSTVSDQAPVLPRTDSGLSTSSAESTSSH